MCSVCVHTLYSVYNIGWLVGRSACGWLALCSMQEVHANKQPICRCMQMEKVNGEGILMSSGCTHGQYTERVRRMC